MITIGQLLILHKAIQIAKHDEGSVHDYLQEIQISYLTYSPTSPFARMLRLRHPAKKTTKLMTFPGHVTWPASDRSQFKFKEILINIPNFHRCLQHQLLILHTQLKALQSLGPDDFLPQLDPRTMKDDRSNANKDYWFLADKCNQLAGYETLLRKNHRRSCFAHKICHPQQCKANKGLPASTSWILNEENYLKHVNSFLQWLLRLLYFAWRTTSLALGLELWSFSIIALDFQHIQLSVNQLLPHLPYLDHN